MFGSIFLLTQYLQFVLGYSPLEAGIRMLPVRGDDDGRRAAQRADRRAVRHQGRRGHAAWRSRAIGARRSSTGLRSTARYWPDVVWRMMLMALGMALTMAPATESIMGSLPLAKAGVGSAVNDTTRQVGGALGVAIIGSVLSSIYGSRRSRDFFARRTCRTEGRRRPCAQGLARRRARRRRRIAELARRVAAIASPSAANRRSSTACTSVCSSPRGAALLGAIVACRLPAARARRDRADDAEYAGENVAASARAPTARTSPCRVAIRRRTLR